MNLTNFPPTRALFFLGIFAIFLLFISCEDPSSVEKPQPEEQASPPDFFGYSPDSVNAVLVRAIDTLRERNKTNPFVSNFMEERGLPVWNKASGYYKEGTPLFRVPVRHAQKKKITGIVYIEIKDKQPVYSWTPRGKKVDGKISQAIEAIIWGYEKRVFGKTHTDEGLKIMVKQIADGKSGNNISDDPTDCSKVCVPGDCHNRPWICDDAGEGTGEGDSDGGFGDGDGGSGGDGGGHRGGGGGGGSGDDSDGGGNSAKQELIDILKQDDLALLEVPCDQLPKWQEIVQFKPPQKGVIDKLEKLNKNNWAFIDGDWNIQYIEDAAGAVVNMDYFPVAMYKLPNNPLTGKRFTGKGFLSYIRKHFDDFLVGNSTQFRAYNNDEAEDWQSDNHIGAIMRFDINVPGPFTQDGSVISSEKSEVHWKFTTIESPKDWNHPVSGTREFGFHKNSEGIYTFYTRGVDRIAESTDEFIGDYTNAPSAFEGADELWQTFKENVYNFVQNNSGVGRPAYEADNSIYRPDWNEVEDYLNGNGSASDFGCK